MRRWAKWFLFFNSYTPLFLILVVRNLDPSGAPARGGETAFGLIVHSLRLPWFSWALIALIAVSNLTLFVFMWQVRRLAGVSETVSRVSAKTGESLNYIVTYIIPFLGFNSTRDIVPLVILMAVIGIIYVNSNLLYTNPMLAFCGYRACGMTRTRDDSDIVVLTKKRAEELGKSVKTAHLTENIYLEV